MLERIRNGEANGILCWKLNRLARNPDRRRNYKLDVARRNGTTYSNLWERILPSDNVIMMSVEFGMANQFIRDLRVDTKRGLKSKAERGWYSNKINYWLYAQSVKIKGRQRNNKRSGAF